jgi:predicted ArsR family transcriptional regulator
MCRDPTQLRFAFLAHRELGNKDVLKSIGVYEGVQTRGEACPQDDVREVTGMSAPTQVSIGHVASHETDGTTRRRVLELVASRGPVTAGALAAVLQLTAPAVRRHLSLLEEDGKIAVHEASRSGAPRRGRPARRYVVTGGGQSELAGGYQEIARQVLRFLRDTGGSDAVAGFAKDRYDAVARSYAPHLTAETAEGRAAQLVQLLSADGYAASIRPVPAPLTGPTAGTVARAVQLCQGHCPVQHVAEEFPELCEQEARAFSELLGSHVQRLATIAGGAHACTTNIPVNLPVNIPVNIPLHAPATDIPATTPTEGK